MSCFLDCSENDLCTIGCGEDNCPDDPDCQAFENFFLALAIGPCIVVIVVAICICIIILFCIYCCVKSCNQPRPMAQNQMAIQVQPQPAYQVIQPGMQMQQPRALNVMPPVQNQPPQMETALEVGGPSIADAAVVGQQAGLHFNPNSVQRLASRDDDPDVHGINTTLGDFTRVKQDNIQF